MFAFLAADNVTTVAGGGVVLLLGTMLKMIWADRTRGQRVEAALRKTFADERATRELEFTAETAAKKADYSETLIRHQEIHAREVATFQERITGYIEQLSETKEELNTTKGRVTWLEEREKELTAEIRELRMHG